MRCACRAICCAIFGLHPGDWDANDDCSANPAGRTGLLGYTGCCGCWFFPRRVGRLVAHIQCAFKKMKNVPNPGCARRLATEGL
jgi:hypothetical protein